MLEKLVQAPFFTGTAQLLTDFMLLVENPEGSRTPGQGPCHGAPHGDHSWGCCFLRGPELSIRQRCRVLPALTLCGAAREAEGNCEAEPATERVVEVSS